MKKEGRLNRLLAFLLAVALAWSGLVTDTGLLRVQATAVDEVDDSSKKSNDSSGNEDSVDEDEIAATDESSESGDEEEMAPEENEEGILEDKEVEKEASEGKASEEENEVEDDEGELSLASAEEDSSAKLLASFDFEDVSAGEDIVTTSAKASGSYSITESYDESQALYLNGSSQYLTLTTSSGESLLAGCESVSVSVDVNFLRTGTDWLFYAAPNTTAQSYQKEHYIGAFQSGTTLKAEQYNNSGSRGNCAYATFASNAWTHLDLVYSKDATIIYVNGTKLASFSSGFSLTDILKDSPICYIGRANWGSGEYCNASIDNLKIYSGTLTDSEVADLYSQYLDRKVGEVTETGLSLNLGYVTSDIDLPTEYDGEKITWTSSDEKIISNDGKVTRTTVNNEVTLTAKYGENTSEFKLVVLKQGKDAITYVSNSPATGQSGGMMIAKESDEGYEALHKNQPIMYTTKGNKAYVSPVVMRRADGNGFYMLAADGSSAQLLAYTSDDLISYSNETVISTGSVSNISKLAAVYDMTDKRYEIYMQTADGVFLITSEDMEEFSTPSLVNYSFAAVENSPSDAVYANKIGLTTDEYKTLVEKFTNPYNTSVTDTSYDEITILTGTSDEALKDILDEYLADKTVTAKYSDGDENTYSLRFTQESIDNINTNVAGEYTLTGVIGGSANYTDATDELIAERADPYVVYNEDDGYYYFTASYPMDYSSDADGYDRIILRRAKTIEGLSNAKEVCIWDENESDSLGRFIWAPEMHKIGDSWYIVATAALNTGTGTSFNIRPFMMKFSGNVDADSDEILDGEKWDDPELVKAYGNDNILAGMSLDMTYFEAGGTSYLVWADETKNTQNPSGLSYLFIATIDPENPTQLTSAAKCITAPEYTWEQVTYKVNEGPATYIKDGKVYMTFSASGTGSEYCVGLMYADVDADLTNVENWTKLPYPIMTSADFDNEVSGPGHNSFTIDENGNLVIVYHARVTATHSSHTGDSLYDPCRNAYVKTVFFDEDGLPIFNMSDEEFIEGGDTFEVTVKVEGESVASTPVLEYKFDETLTDGVAVDSVGENNAKLVNGASYVQDDTMGQVLYLDGASSFGGTNSYLEFPQGFFDGMDELTISFDVNQVTRGGNYFTFTVGQDDSSYLFYKAMATQEKLAITTTSYKNEKTVSANSVYPNTCREWINIKIVLDGTKMSLYRDGKLIGTNKNTKISMSDLGDDLIAYLGKSFYSSDSYFRGYFDNVKVYSTALTEDEVASSYAIEQAELKSEMSDIDYVADNYEIPDMDAITGNISLPSTVNGVDVKWTSNHEDIISTKEVINEGYDNIPAGVVTRPKKDTQVTLTAVFSKDGEKRSKTYKCTVKAAAKDLDDYYGYLFVHFTGTEGTADCEQVYFSLSKDGLNWTDLNNNEPVLTSTIGESGLRDMYIARTAEGDKFYMISTDLSIYHYNSWSEAGSNGSHSIVVWESDDLINWSEPWLAEIAPEGAGCTWAPEFIYDEKTGEYIVYWASTTLEVDDDENITQEYENHTIYYSKTRDFKHFTEAKVYHSGGTNDNGKVIKVIDSTMIEDDGIYYRYTKNESVGSIAIDYSDSVLGEFTSIDSNFLTSKVPAKVGAVEGPIIFKLNELNEDGKEQWCLYVDRYGTGSGYYPVITTDLSDGEAFEFLDSDEFSLPTKYRHGYVMAVTEEEYKRLSNEDWAGFDDDATEITLDKSNSGNPMLGFDEDGNILYGGDPSILVDGDTVYAYVGCDTSSNESYYMKDWKCYSSKDMINWTYEGTILENADVSWAADNHQAWAGQVVKYNDKYYFYYCTEANSANGSGKSIGVAVSDSPTGGFVDIGKPLVRNIDTYNGVSTWEDIDPTFWIETDEDGVEHRILGWGNVRFFNCELEEDMITIVDKDGDADTLTVETAADDPDADIKVGLINGMPSGHQYTEAPYYYSHKLADGTTRYYMFFAYDWREQMAYAYTDSLEDFLNNEWTFGGVVMEPSATANTNHMAVFDFRGQSYFVYHDGSLPHGSGFRRVACVEAFEVNEDGSIPYIKKTATGLTGTLSKITDLDGSFIASETFENTLDDNDYPMTDKEIIVDFYQDGEESEWEINPGKANTTKDCYVSIESNYKAGLYLAVGDMITNGVYDVVLAQDVKGTTAEANSMTFRTIEGLAGTGVTFESVLYHGYYLASVDGDLILTSDPDTKAATFEVSSIDSEGKLTNPNVEVSSSKVQKTKRMYTTGQTVDTSDIRVRATLSNGKIVTISDVEVDMTSVDMSVVGSKKIKVTYEYAGTRYDDEVTIKVVDKSYRQ